MNILIADDEPNICQGILEYIQCKGSKQWRIVAVVHDGQAVLNKCASGVVDLVLLDIKMPLLSGTEVMERLLEMDAPPTIVIISGYAEFSVAKQALQYGALDYILKPVDPAELMRCLEKAYAGLLAQRGAKATVVEREQLSLYSVPVRAAARYVMEKYGTTLRLEEIARQACVHPVYLSEIFKKEVGRPLFQYITEYRIQVAKKLLIETQSNLETISEQVGFQNQHYFSNVFKKTVGVSPREFRHKFKLNG